MPIKWGKKRVDCHSARERHVFVLKLQDLQDQDSVDRNGRRNKRASASMDNENNTKEWYSKWQWQKETLREDIMYDVLSNGDTNMHIQQYKMQNDTID